MRIWVVRRRLAARSAEGKIYSWRGLRLNSDEEKLVLIESQSLTSVLSSFG